MKKGSKVLCIADKFVFGHDVPTEYKDAEMPVRLVEYTADRLVYTPFGKAITLVEIRNKPIRHADGTIEEPLFGTNRFDEL